LAGFAVRRLAILIHALLGKMADSLARWLERRCLR
jgi:hypothetical protein